MTWTRDFGLVEYLACSNDSVRGWERTALREGAPGIRSVLAYFASRGSALYPAVLDIDPSALEPRAAAALARVMALQEESDVDGAIQLLRGSTSSGARASGLALLAQLLLVSGRTQECAEALSRFGSRLPLMDRAALEIDLSHPRHGGEQEHWWSLFSMLFSERGLEQPLLDEQPLHDSGLPLLDRIGGSPSEVLENGPLVSVMLTTYRPGQSLLTSARSLLAQSWRPLEVIVVDDASGPEYSTVLDEVEALDDRVTVLRLAQNGGTYAARNAALEIAQGEFVTGQDDDDWSHPRRIERQLQPLINEAASATCVRALRADEDLCITQPGHRPLTRASVSFMARRTEIVRVGGFLTARKGADSELIRRVEATSGAPVVELTSPLAVCRYSNGSLSRSDFRPGWHHPARAALWSSTSEVHDGIKAGQLSTPEGLSAIVIPNRLGGPSGPPRLDVVIAADFSRSDLTRRGVLPEIRAGLAVGMQVGILHLDGAQGGAQAWTRLDRQVQRMINDRAIHRVLLDDDVAVGELVVLEARALQFPPSGDRRLRADRGWIIADHAPSDPTLRMVSYVPRECSDTFSELFGVAPTWVARDHLIRGILAPTMRGGVVAEDCNPHPASIPQRSIRRRSRPALGPVAGKVATALADWPDSDAELGAAYPASDREMRVLGSTSVALERLGRRVVPASWVIFEPGDMSVAAFMRQIDAYVDFPGSLSESGRARSLALAAGVPVVLPRTLAPTYGDAALYAEADEANEVLARIFEDRDLVDTQAMASRAFARSQVDPRRRPWLSD